MTTDPFATPGPMIAASILSADFARLGAEIDDALSHGADFLHLDVMDGHFVPNISFGPPVISAVRKCTKAFFDAHLMISDPARYAPMIAQAGAQNITFQVEAVSDALETARTIRNNGCRVGITLNPATPVEKIWPALDEVDVVLVMSVVPGFGGQKFMPEVLAKVTAIKKRLRQNQRIEIDGGIHRDTIKAARDAGVDWFVVGSGIFDARDRATAIAELRSKL